ncbi:hypothetical protein [Rubrivivax gelatinosus]|uniref:Uncharacterized protein n=1 Tax=Rubrivivax gelatinosus TaxID=28068 RepID=A0A4V6NQ25_RUBGE|nr:hypothetical protein [Rubrivivax gelatinosus]MBK1686668.1 hypothetical protein [Rubrivivax gelatinosus]TCP05308.1 hypothetical protein EV684_101180 [Rubrivivax gelatinosus]
MGAIRKLIDDFDSSKEQGQMQRELVENLARLAESKAEFFELQISTNLRTAGSPDNQTVPVEAVLNSETYTHAIASDSVSKIGDSVSSALKSFCSGGKDEILTGVGNLITDALTVFLGSGGASTGTKKQYYVLTEGWSVVRVDLMAWYLEVQAQSIRSTMQKASAFVVVKSAVDLSKIRFNTFLNIYRGQLASMKLKDDQINTALDEARTIYDRFQRSNAPAVTGPHGSVLAVSSLPGKPQA